MFGLSLGFVLEMSVAILLATTIGYCVILNQRLKRLHADRDQLRKMVADLVQATTLANAAVGELKTAALEADAMLQARMQAAETFGVELANHVNAGQQIGWVFGQSFVLFHGSVLSRSTWRARAPPQLPSAWAQEGG